MNDELNDKEFPYYYSKKCVDCKKHLIDHTHVASISVGVGYRCIDCENSRHYRML